MQVEIRPAGSGLSRLKALQYSLVLLLAWHGQFLERQTSLAEVEGAVATVGRAAQEFTMILIHNNITKHHPESSRFLSNIPFLCPC